MARAFRNSFPLQRGSFWSYLMQQRQLRLGDVLDDYCPRERRLTNHAVVAMVGPDVKQTRCTTCNTEHKYKQARVPRQRRKPESSAALYSQVLADGPKRVAHEAPARETPPPDMTSVSDDGERAVPEKVEPNAFMVAASAKGEGLPYESSAEAEPAEAANEQEQEIEEGPVHRPLIRATLPRPQGQPPPTRPTPDFTIRQPGGRPNRFPPRHQRGGQPFHGTPGDGSLGGPMRSGGAQRQGRRPPHEAVASRHGRRHGPGRKRSK